MVCNCKQLKSRILKSILDLLYIEFIKLNSNINDKLYYITNITKLINILKVYDIQYSIDDNMLVYHNRIPNLNASKTLKTLLHDIDFIHTVGSKFIDNKSYKINNKYMFNSKIDILIFLDEIEEDNKVNLTIITEKKSVIVDAITNTNYKKTLKEFFDFWHYDSQVFLDRGLDQLISFYNSTDLPPNFTTRRDMTNNISNFRLDIIFYVLLALFSFVIVFIKI